VRAGDVRAGIARLARAAGRRGRRAAKVARQIARGRSGRTPVPVFVGGCHRSGTSMLMESLEVSPHTTVFHESPRSLAFSAFRLRSDAVIARLIAWSPAPWVVFKPVCDAHRLDRYLERFPAARVIWPWRRYQDVANSAVKKWGDHQKQIIRAIARGGEPWLGWRGERLEPDVTQRVAALYHDGMSPEEGAAIQWYLRNHFYFRLGLDRDPRVLLLRYEDLVTSPKEHFERIFAFLGDCPLDGLDLSRIDPRSIGKASFPAIDPAIERLCEEMVGRLEERSRRGP
jgi:hypothetical protein